MDGGGGGAFPIIGRLMNNVFWRSLVGGNKTRNCMLTMLVGIHTASHNSHTVS